MKSILFFPIVFFSVFVSAQDIDTLKIMTYNVNNYGFPATSGCPLLNSTLKHPYMRSIMGYENPDILGLEKMAASPSSFSADTVIQKVLDSVCEGCWGHSPFTDVSGYYKVDMLYFKTTKLAFVSTTTIYSSDSNISDINLHRLYYKSSNLATTHDTAFINVIVCHIKSGNDRNDSTERAIDIKGAMNWLNSHVTAAGNYILMGDLNTQTSTEACFQAAVNSSNANTKFTDPSAQVGNWSANPSAYAHYLTQSTRTSDPGDCASTSGMSEIFDHILCTSPIMQGTQYVKYVPGSYTVVGQDGQHTNKAINASPANSAAPTNIINALYYMSEHLPVTSLLAINTSPQTGIVATEQPSSFICGATANDLLSIRSLMSGNGNVFSALIYDIQGRLISTNSIYNEQNNFLPTAALASGQYILVIKDANGIIFTHRFAKVNN